MLDMLIVWQHHEDRIAIGQGSEKFSGAMLAARPK